MSEIDKRSALDRLHDASPAARERIIRRYLLREATQERPPHRGVQPKVPYVPLFSRSGVKDSPELQEKLLDIGVTYVDMILFKHVANKYRMPATLSDEQYRMLATLNEKEAIAEEKKMWSDIGREKEHWKRQLNLTDKESMLWSEHAMDVLSNYPEELAAYCGNRIDANHPEIQKIPQEKILLGTLVKLCQETSVALAGRDAQWQIPREGYVSDMAGSYLNGLLEYDFPRTPTMNEDVYPKHYDPAEDEEAYRIEKFKHHRRYGHTIPKNPESTGEPEISGMNRAKGIIEDERTMLKNKYVNQAAKNDADVPKAR